MMKLRNRIPDALKCHCGCHRCRYRNRGHCGVKANLCFLSPS